MIALLRSFILVFVAMTVLDAIYALWAIAAASKWPATAGMLAMGIILLSGVVTRAYVADKRMLIPAALGAFVGTWIAVVFA